jgi:hypothetical protein
MWAYLHSPAYVVMHDIKHTSSSAVVQDSDGGRTVAFRFPSRFMSFRMEDRRTRVCSDEARLVSLRACPKTV